ncbi:MAG: tryptophan--tRNA ligase [Acidobacteria bacterium]|nr:tryptophan--tRNA ligase [Acidobacteriota bacterium]
MTDSLLMSSGKPRIFSGMQPSGVLHIGNYLGALRNWAKIQYDFEPIFCVVDQHAITVYQDPKALRESIEQVAALYLAAGIDPDHSAVFVQSQVPGHVELGWIFTCVTPMGWLGRMTQFKAKSGNQETVGTGLFCYPALMAADILLYQAKIVPVGEDQAQHLELTRNIAERFNHLYGDTFVVPETRLPAVGARVMGLDDPTQKMSKSAEGANHAISMLEEPGRIKKLIGRAVTDSNPQVEWETAGPGVRNLLGIFQAFSEQSNAEMRAEFDGMRYGDLKKRVTEMVVESLSPIQAKYRELMNNRDHLRHILQRSAERITPIAEQTVQLAKERTGLFSG